MSDKQINDGGPAFPGFPEILPVIVSAACWSGLPKRPTHQRRLDTASCCASCTSTWKSFASATRPAMRAWRMSSLTYTWSDLCQIDQQHTPS